MSKEKYNKRITDIAIRANNMRYIFVNSQFSVDGSFRHTPELMLEGINTAIANEQMFESLDESLARDIISMGQESIRDYQSQHGVLPRDEVLASAHKSLENMLYHDTKKAGEKTTAGMMLESIDKSLSTTQGIEINAKMAGLILPTALSTETLDAISMVPATTDEIEIFKVERKTASNFGDMKKGTVIDSSVVGQYSQMRQRFPLPAPKQPDGKTTDFAFDTATDLVNTKEPMPVRQGSVAIYINHVKVARDLDTQDGIFAKLSATNTLQGDVDYDAGKITFKTGTALEAGTQIHVEFEIDIETKPELIPEIENSMSSKRIRPSQNALAATQSIQAMFALSREYGLDLQSMQMSQLRDFLSAEKTNRHLADINFATTSMDVFNVWTPVDGDWKLHRELLREAFLSVSQKILGKTNTCGMIGMYAGISASTLIKAMGSQFFTPAPNYRQVNKVHFAGTLFGMWKVFECPHTIDEDEILCYGRGDNHLEAGYVAGDAVPATMYTHAIGRNLKAANTIWELAYGEVNPFNGQDYFYKLKLINEPVVNPPAADADTTTSKKVKAAA